jgi:hypothetical protein
MLDPRKKRRFFEIVWKEEHDYLRKLNDLDSLFFVIFSKYDTNATCAPCEPLDLKTDEAKTSFTKLFSWNEDEMENGKPEIERYLKEPLLPESSDALHYWKSKKNLYPVLSVMARDFFGAQSSAVACEEVFSSGVDFVTPNRSRLSDESISHFLCLQYWWKRLEK